MCSTENKSDAAVKPNNRCGSTPGDNKLRNRATVPDIGFSLAGEHLSVNLTHRRYAGSGQSVAQTTPFA